METRVLCVIQWREIVLLDQFVTELLLNEEEILFGEMAGENEALDELRRHLLFRGWVWCYVVGNIGHAYVKCGKRVL